jgi:hypothetical protein
VGGSALPYAQASELMASLIVRQSPPESVSVVRQFVRQARFPVPPCRALKKLGRMNNDKSRSGSTPGDHRVFSIHASPQWR